MTYTLETLIQAGSKDLRVASVPVTARPTARRSRLYTSAGKYVLVQGANVLRITALYKPLKMFSAAAGVFLVAGLVIGLRFLWFYFFGNPGGHVNGAGGRSSRSALRSSPVANAWYQCASWP